MEWGFVHELWKELAWALRDLAPDLPASSWGGHHPLLFWRTSSDWHSPGGHPPPGLANKNALHPRMFDYLGHG